MRQPPRPPTASPGKLCFAVVTASSGDESMNRAGSAVSDARQGNSGHCPATWKGGVSPSPVVAN